MRVKNKRGMAAVEFLITLPLLLMVLTIVVEFGTAYIRYNTLSKSVQNAVRYSIRDSQFFIADFSSIKNMVVYGKKTVIDGDEPILYSFGVENVSVVYDDTDDDEKYVVVTGTYTYVPILRFLYFDKLSDLTMSSSAVMRAKP